MEVLSKKEKIFAALIILAAAVLAFTGCGGSGHVGSTISTYNPHSKMYEMKQDYHSCPNCGGKSYMILYK